MSPVIKAVLSASSVTVVLALMIVVGSRNLTHFDAALVGYTFATLFATFAITYRYAMWLQRPPTAMYWKRGWQLLFDPKYIGGHIASGTKRLVADFAFNRYIYKRSAARGHAHLLIMWGCIIAAAITFPLVFGWLHFDNLPGRLDWYQVRVFGFPTFSFPIESFFGFVIFHGLVWSSILVIAGVMLAMRRRMRDHGAAAVQMFTEDMLPLILLFAVSVSGVMITVSYTWMRGYAYEFLALFHAVTVIFTLLWMPFGKLFHIFQRPAQIGVAFYKDASVSEEKAKCRRCGQPFTSLRHARDLITVEGQLGYRYDMPDSETEHYQWICPRCRRALVVLAQSRLWTGIRPDPMPENDVPFSQTGFGTVSTEDRENFHP